MPADPHPPSAVLASRFGLRVLQRAPKLACFDPGDYQAFNPDLAAVDAYNHLAEHGIWEKRKLIAPERLTATLSRAVVLNAHKPLDAGGMERGYRGALRIEPVLHLPIAPEEVDTLMAERLRAALEAVGVEVRIAQGPPLAGGAGAVIVNPARVFGEGRAEAELELYSACVMAAAQSPHDADFNLQLPYLLGSAGVVAVEAETHALFREAQTPSVWLGGVYAGAPGDPRALAAHPVLRGLSRSIKDAPWGLPWAERPIDVVALEPVSDPRLRAWERMADRMAGFRTVVYQPPAGQVTPGLEHRLRGYLYGRSKVVLHLHTETPGALPAAIMEEAIVAGAVILSEPCAPHWLMTPGRHYLEASARRMPDAVEGLIAGGDGAASAEAMAAAARRALGAHLDLELTGLALVNLLTTAAENRP